MTLAGKKAMTAYAFLAVPLLFFVCVRFGPMLYMMAMSLTDWSVLRKTLHFVGLDSFRAIFADPVFLQALGNTARYAVFGAPIVIVISLGLALLLDRIGKGRGLFRFIYVLPYITPVVAVSWVWRWMFQTPPLGILNAALGKLGLPAMEFLNSTAQALPSILVVNVWIELGYCTTVFLAGIQTIPRGFIEAARIDGASGRKVLTAIMLPLLLPVTLFLTVMEGIQFLRIFTQVYNMSTQATGGPLNSTKSAALYIYQKAFTNFEMGVAAGASIVLFTIIMAVTLVQMKFFDRKLNY
ncbi:MAG: sugar ABC transporter permease [Spirochaetes bacterium]|nr:sugar ABC transporter permease [Spirochaetota bacterium]